jgi:peptidoglycan/LPS O-acetylase OafA/YrhL
MDHGAFRSSRYLRELDGLRALAILQVVSTHTTDPIWTPLIGPVGVTISFVISGFIITTLLLREEDKRGSIRITDFYLRRAFRLLPLYYLVLAVYVLLVGVLHVQPGAQAAWHTLPYYLGYQNDLVSGNWGFNITWSLAMEEKFYLLWPLVFFAPALLRRWRFPATVGLALGLMPFALLPGRGAYPAYFAAIVVGCLVAQLMHRPPTYARLRPLTGTAATTLILVLALVEGATLERQNGPHVLFAVLVALALPACLTGPRRLRAVLASRPLAYVGTRAYALYLVHRLGKGVVDRVLPPHGAVWEQGVRYPLIVALGLAAAEVLRRTVERPMINLGRRFIAHRAERRETAGARGRRRLRRPLTPPAAPPPLVDAGERSPRVPGGGKDLLRSGGRGFGSAGASSVSLVSGLVGVDAAGEAVPEDADPPVRQGSEDGLTGSAGGPEVAVAGVALGDHVVAFAGAAGDRGGPRIALQRVRGFERGNAFADLAGSQGRAGDGVLGRPVGRQAKHRR